MSPTPEQTPAPGPALPEAAEAAARPLQLACLGLVGIAVLGLFLAWIVEDNGLESPNHFSSNNIFFYLYYSYDRWAFMAFAGLAIAAGAILPRVQQELRWPAALQRLRLWHVALAVFAVMVVGTYIVCLNHPLAMDEFLANFQAQIFLGGHVLGPIPEEWRPYSKAMAPVLSVTDPVRGTWAAYYLPIYALLRTPFYWLGLDTILNAALSAATVLLTAACAGRIWPDERRAPWIAGLLLALGPQFLITGMTAYAMPAHLCFSMLWLWLWLRNDTTGYLLLPLVGVLAIGLHQPNIHALFAAPFLLLLPFRAGWQLTAYVVIVYAAGCVGWLEFMKYRYPLQETAAGAATAETSTQLSFVASLFRAPSFFSWVKLGMNFTQFFVWQPLVLGAFLLVSFFHWRRWSAPLRCLAVVFLACLGFYFLSTVGQGHGWGNRFMHPYLGATALLATAGWMQLRHLPATTWLLAASLACSLLLDLPYRAYETRQVTEPFARSDQFLRSRPEPMVVVQVSPIWYGQDLVRNHGALTASPKFFFLEALTRQQYEALKQRGPVRYVPATELFPLGLTERRRPAQP